MSIQSAAELKKASGTPPESHSLSPIRILVYILLLAALGVAIWIMYRNHQKAAAAKEQVANALAGRPVPVQVITAARRPMPIYLTALGTVTPNMTVTVRARVSGQLLPVRFTEGQTVHQGETILEVDPRPYKAALDQAKGTLAHDQALLNNAQSEYKRYQALYDAGVVSREALDANKASLGQYEGAIAADKAAVENAQLQLSWCSIQAPITGKIGLRLVDPGNLVSANTTDLVIINQLQPIAVYFTLPENQLPQVLRKLTHDNRIVVEAYDRSDTQKIATGRLLATDNQIDTTTGTAKLKAVFDNADGVLFPNQFVNVHLIMENRPDALVVPSTAIQTGVNGNFVWTVAKGADGKTTAGMQPIKIDLAEGENTILESGPEIGASVVVDGAERLRPGQIVTVSGQHAHQGASKQGQEEQQ
ncbi:MAG TPA: efflux RND transporter periplasmic adaptor subunit [Terracidiphilus sp.]|jgi:multidrug efflux system membrane fusion protein|nr:efflux RND transporter periplasmic adaptor subunit [Terracidiphilus sp.]